MNPLRRIGSHVPVAGGLVRRALPAAELIGAEVLQIFTGSPRGWAPPRPDPAEAARFRAECAARGWPLYVHAAYLINLASPDPLTLKRSIDTLAATLAAAELLGAAGVVVHTGSSVDGDRPAALVRTAAALGSVLAGAPPVPVLMEPTSGAANAMASTLRETGEYLAAVGTEGIGLCLDTCHLHAAGEALAEPGVFEASLEALEAEIGPGRIGLVHFNDSRDAWNSRRDRHEALGQGTLGEDALRAVTSSAVLGGVPLVSETNAGAADVAYAKWLDRGEAADG